MMKRIAHWFTAAKTQIAFGYILIVITLIGWPLSIMYTDEPPFILSLSWAALTLTAISILFTAYVKLDVEVVEDTKEDKPGV